MHEQERERLIELIKDVECHPEKTCPNLYNNDNCPDCEYDEGDVCNCFARKADYLLANGVIVLPCKVGDTVHVIYDGYVTSAKVLAFYIDHAGGMFDLQIKTKDETAIGFKTVIDKDNYTFDKAYLTKEEAEAALKEEENE